jgi:hypothetical protein
LNNPDDTSELTPQSRAAASKASALARAADVLAREAATDEVDALEIGTDGADVVVSLDVWPVLREHSSTELVSLDLPSHGTET